MSSWPNIERDEAGDIVAFAGSRSDRPPLRLAVDLVTVIDAFLSQPDLASTTRAKYRQTLMVVEDELGDAPVTGAGLGGVVVVVVEQHWHHAAGGDVEAPRPRRPTVPPTRSREPDVRHFWAPTQTAAQPSASRA